MTRNIRANEADTRGYIAPDFPMALNFEDCLNGCDPLIEFAKTINAEVIGEVDKDATLRTTWRRASQKKVTDD